MRYQIRFNLKSIQGVVLWKVFCTFLLDPNGNRYVPYLYFKDGIWSWNYNWLENGFDTDNPSAVLATLFISPSSFGGGVLLVHHGFKRYKLFIYYPTPWTPKAQEEVFLPYQVF